MSFVMIPEELLEVDISAAQLRTLIHIINNTYSSGKYAGCCCLGYQNLADLCFTHKGAAINTLKQLEQLGFIEINRRERFNRSNAIKLTLENGYQRCRSKSGDCSGNEFERSLNRTDERSLNRTVDGSLNRTLGSLNRTEGSLNRTPHIDLKFKNLDLKNKNACARAKQGSLNRTDELGGAEGHIAPADDAAGRSMLERGQAAQTSAKEVRAAAEAANIDAAALWKECQAEFDDIADDITFGQTGNRYFLRKKSKFTLTSHVRALEVADWLAARGLTAEVLGENVHYSNEQEVA